MLLMLGAILPAAAHAGVFSDFFASITNSARADAILTTDGGVSLQNLVLPQPAMNIDPSPARGGGGVTIVGGTALLPQEGPSGTIADIEKPADGTISTYVVRPGDTISAIAAMFNVTANTVLSANDLPGDANIQVGQKLIILPVTSILYTVKNGDTLASVAKRYGGDSGEIATRNGIVDGQLVVGIQVVIPNGEVPASAPSSVSSSKSVKKFTSRKTSEASGTVIPFANNPAEPAHNVGAPGSSSQIAYYRSPLLHYIQTQGIHGYNAVDLAAPEGTPIYAAAAGSVIVAREGGWNGGYGSYLVISHGNGAQTLYSHMSKVIAYDGESVVQGQIIGYVGETGLATGPHLHFEIRNGIRNPF